MQLSDNITNSEILILYMNEFKHLDQGTKEYYGGHPIAKRVYRTIHNKDTDTYRVIHSQGVRPNALSFSSLAMNNETFNYQMIALNSRNIIDYEILEEDLDKIIGWGDNSDIKRILTEGRVVGTTQDAPSFLEDFANHFVKVIEDDKKMDVFEKLEEYSETAVGTLEDLAEHIMKGGELSLENMNLSIDDVFGPGINIGNAQQAIYKYTSDHRRDPKDLLVAMEYLVAEYSRATFI